MTNVNKAQFWLEIKTGIGTVVSLDEEISNSLDDHDTRLLPVTISLKDEEKEAAVVDLIIIDSLIYEDPDYILSLADDLDIEYYDVLEDFIGSAEYYKLKGSCSNVGYISRFYVMPDYRKNGIASYLLRNLELMLDETLNFNLGCFLLFVTPLDYIGGNWIRKDNEIMENIMTKMFKKHGFKKIRKKKSLVKLLFM